VRAQTPGRFRGLPNPDFPDTSVTALALLNLEGNYLARALRAKDKSEARRWARAAVAGRSRRCGDLGPVECARERALEQSEGTATFVTAALLGEALGYGPDGVWQDSLARALSPILDEKRLERWYLYDTGHAWLLLLERLGPAGWQERAESVAPDQVLAGILAVGPQASDMPVNAGEDTAWTEALESAQRVVQRTPVRRDSAEREFWERPGVPIRVYFGRVTQINKAVHVLIDGRLERTLHFGGNEVTFRGPSRAICCPGEMTIAPVVGRHATVDGQIVRLDRPGVNATGVVGLDLPEITLRFGSAAVAVFADSVTIHALRR
jgi:hypothetical protein